MMEEVNFVAEHTLNDHTVDLTFYNVHEYPRDLDYQILGKEEMVLVLSASSPAASKAVERRLQIPMAGFTAACGRRLHPPLSRSEYRRHCPETVFRIWNGTSYPDAHPQQRDVHPPGHGRHGRGLRTRELLPLFKETVQFSPCACFSIGNEKNRKHPDRSLSEKPVSAPVCEVLPGYDTGSIVREI